MIALSNVCMEYRRGIQVLNNISLHVKSGEIFTLLGPNGAGKTTLIKILSTLILPTKGNILIDNKNIFHETHNIRKSISCVSQNTSIDDFLTVKEKMVFQGKLDGINKNTGSQMITGIFSYCQIILLLIKEKSFVQTIEARTVTGFILCHFMNCVMDSIKTKLFCP